MVLIPVPKPPRSAIDPNRPVNALLEAQIMHLHDAEKRLPAKYHTDVYINAIKTEGEASEYIRAVTEAIHRAHAEAAAKRMPKRKGVIEIAAVADEEAERRLTRKSGKNTPRTKKRRK